MDPSRTILRAQKKLSSFLEETYELPAKLKRRPSFAHRGDALTDLQNISEDVEQKMDKLRRALSGLGRDSPIRRSLDSYGADLLKCCETLYNTAVPVVERAKIVFDSQGNWTEDLEFLSLLRTLLQQISKFQVIDVALATMIRLVSATLQPVQQLNVSAVQVLIDLRPSDSKQQTSPQIRRKPTRNANEPTQPYDSSRSLGEQSIAMQRCLGTQPPSVATSDSGSRGYSHVPQPAQSTTRSINPSISSEAPSEQTYYNIDDETTSLVSGPRQNYTVSEDSTLPSRYTPTTTVVPSSIANLSEFKTTMKETIRALVLPELQEIKNLELSNLSHLLNLSSAVVSNPDDHAKRQASTTDSCIMKIIQSNIGTVAEWTCTGKTPFAGNCTCSPACRQGWKMWRKYQAGIQSRYYTLSTIGAYTGLIENV